MFDADVWVEGTEKFDICYNGNVDMLQTSEAEQQVNLMQCIATLSQDAKDVLYILYNAPEQYTEICTPGGKITKRTVQLFLENVFRKRVQHQRKQCKYRQRFPQPKKLAEATLDEIHEYLRIFVL